MRKILFCFLALSASFATFGQDSIPKKELNDLKFRSIGPAGMSGRITAIQVDPRDENHIFAGSASGGLWESNNGGTSWQCIFNNEAVSSVGALALDPQNPDLIWVGTGEGNPRNSNTGGAGIYRSIDGGKSWQLMGLEKTRHIHRILVHPYNPKVVYVAAIGNPWADSEHRGVYKTIDGGKSWQKILYRNPATGAAEMVMDPQNPDKILVNMWEHRRNPWFFKSGGEGSGLFITHDGGETWVEKTEKDGLPKGELGRMGLAIAASQNSRIYAFIEKKGKNALYRSDDGGNKWSKISEDENIGNRPFYYAEIYVDPQNENRVYSIWSVISRSEDGGKTWEVIAPYSYIHPDHHAFYIHPQNPSYILNGNDGGMNISRDRGRSWRFVSNLPLAQFYHINYDMQIPYNIYGGMQDNGSWKGPAYVWKADGIRNDYWEELYFGDGFDVVPDLQNPDYVYAQSQEGYVGRVHTPSGYTESIRPVHPENKKLRFNWNAPIAADPFDDKRIYFGAQYVFSSEDQGRSWQVISPDLTTNDTTKQNYGESGGLTYDVTGAENYTTLLCIEPSSLERDLIWASSDDGKLQLTKDGGQQWEDLSERLKAMPRGAWIPQVVHSRFKKGAAFVVVNDYRRGDESAMLFYTEDYGKSFKNIGSALPAYVISVAQDLKDPQILFAGTQRGLYFSWDFGQHWQKWTNDLPTTLISDIKIHPREDDLILGTFGRSAFVFDGLEVFRERIAEIRQNESAKLSLYLEQDPFRTATKRANGSRFPADGIFKGENRARGLIAYLHHTFEESDSLGKAQIRFEIYDQKTKEKVRTFYRKVPEKQGLTRFDIWLSHRGLGFPSKNLSENDTSEEGSLALITGNYLLKVTLKGISDSAYFTYHPDPRLEVSPAEEKANFEFAQEFDQSLAPLHEVVKRLNRHQKVLSLAKQIASLQLAEEQLKAWNDSVKSFDKELRSLQESIYGKEVDGYYDQPHTLSAQFYAAQSYLRRSWSGVNQQAKLLSEAYLKEQGDFIQKFERFEKEKWSKFDALIEQFGLKINP